ncbi:MAG TPA: hypothetical protein VHZ26_02615 [Caulobacteraceae bacterium]|nr:hypothetical protein [Caulobacteraceae bacterium]
MTADRAGHACRRPMRLAGRATAGAFIAFDALELVSLEDLTSTDCPEARMAGGNHNNNNNNQNYASHPFPWTKAAVAWP